MWTPISYGGMEGLGWLKDITVDFWNIIDAKQIADLFMRTVQSFQEIFIRNLQQNAQMISRIVFIYLERICSKVYIYICTFLYTYNDLQYIQ